MVLDNASPMVQDGLVDDSPASDADPYTSAQSSSEPVSTLLSGDLPPYIDTRDLAKPFPFFGPLEGWTDDFLKRQIARRARLASAVMQRGLHQPEWDAIAQNQAKFHAICSYSLPVSSVAAYLRSEQPSVKSKFKFPCWTPKPEQINLQKLGPFEGDVATRIWHVIRRSAYFSVFLAVGKALFKSYGLAVVNFSEMQDSRLREYKQILADITTAEMQKRREQHSTGVQASSEGSMIRQRQPMQQAGPHQESQVSSPTPSIGLFPMDDDASPTAGNEVAESGFQKESAWDRIRGGQDRTAPRQPLESNRQPGRDAWTQRRGQPGGQGNGSDGDSFSFATNDEDRQLAQNEAQRDFDARIERERRGQDFDDSKRGWRR